MIKLNYTVFNVQFNMIQLVIRGPQFGKNWKINKFLKILFQLAYKMLNVVASSRPNCNEILDYLNTWSIGEHDLSDSSIEEIKTIIIDRNISDFLSNYLLEKVIRLSLKKNQEKYPCLSSSKKI